MNNITETFSKKKEKKKFKNAKNVFSIFPYQTLDVTQLIPLAKTHLVNEIV